MKVIKKSKVKGNFWPLLIILFLGILASRTLLFQSGYFNMHDDLQMMRQLELEKCFLDKQIPCRWVPDMGYGFGFPLFNFYPPLPYLIGQVFRFLGASFVTTAKLTFAMSIIGSGIAMYYLAKKFFGRLGATLSSAFYLWAPYHAVDVYVRGAMNEAWALVWFPLILLFSYNIIVNDLPSFSKKKKGSLYQFLKSVITNKNVVGLALSYAALLLTHNLMVMIFTPVLAGWVLLHLWINGNWKKLIPLAVSGIWSIGFAAFFTIPALTENKFTQIKGQLIGYYDYTAHFVSIRQLLFSRFWGYGPSVWLEDDGMSFQAGYVHWILSLIIGLLLTIFIFGLVRKNKSKVFPILRKHQLLLTTSYLLLVGWIGAFMTHPKSIFIWNAIPQLGYTQFPWRFLTLVIFSFSFVIGIIPRLMQSKIKIFNFAMAPFRMALTFLLVLLLLALNWNYFLPEHGKMGPLTDDQKFTGAAWDLQQTAGIYDYLPETAVMAPREPMKSLTEVMVGSANVSNEKAGTDWGEFRADITSDKSTLRISIFEFPGWKTFVDGQEVNHYVADTEEWGRMYIDLTKGIHNVRVQFINTPVRSVSNWISLFSLVLLGYSCYLVRAKKVSR